MSSGNPENPANSKWALEGADPVAVYESELRDVIEKLNGATMNLIGDRNIASGAQKVPGGSVNAFKRLQKTLQSLLRWFQSPRLRETANGVLEFYEHWFQDITSLTQDLDEDNRRRFLEFGLAFQELGQVVFDLKEAYSSSRPFGGEVMDTISFTLATENVPEQEDLYAWVNDGIREANESVNLLEDVILQLPKRNKNLPTKEGDSAKSGTQSVNTRLSADIDRLRNMMDVASVEATRILLDRAAMDKGSQGDDEVEHTVREERKLGATGKIHAFTPLFETVDGIPIAKEVMLQLKDEEGNVHSLSLSDSLNHLSFDLPTLLAEAALTKVISDGNDEDAEQSFGNRLDEITYKLEEEMSKHTVSVFGLDSLSLPSSEEDPNRLRVRRWSGRFLGHSQIPSRAPSIHSYRSCRGTTLIRDEEADPEQHRFTPPASTVSEL
ncbi:hypothetical protein QFC24_006244 [Naganishia onofrii]|uniref:Uncharacterized protein n=1 Tax=Naganishia onofrii TaxID=1851511 RepID=A0ACC2X488_9TREE|nr:hypothetical protein QFC24_006244 [Naganishia onofrii]